MTADGKGSLDLIGDIISNQMSISTDRIFSQNNTQDLPQDSNLFVVLGYMTRMPYGSKSEYQTIDGVYTEKQSVNMVEDVLISLISKNTDARDRAYEVLMALKSTYSQYVQENNRLHISTINEVTDSSFLEATARLHRYDVRCRVIRTYNKQQSVDYYDKFNINAWIKENGDITKITVRKDY